MVYYITKLLIRPVSGKVSSYLLVNEKKSMSRLSLSDAESAALNSAKNEDELLDVLKTFALEQSWVPRNVKDLPVWLLTGHIVQDANPNRWPLVS